MATIPNTRPLLNLEGEKRSRELELVMMLSEEKRAEVCDQVVPKVLDLRVDPGAESEQTVEHGRLPPHVERRQHQPSTRQPGLVPDPMSHRGLNGGREEN